ncbi:MAG: ATP-binding protein [Archangium sp.]
MTPAQEQGVLLQVYLRGDRIVRVATLVHFAIALALAPFYDTWFIALPVAVLAAGMFWACSYLIPGHFFTRVVAGISLQGFCALHIFQLHGMPEMHFFFFTSFTLMILYKDWRAMWPGASLIIAQHILFAVLHNSGVKLYFFEETRVGVFKLFFHFGIAIAQVAIAGVVAHNLRSKVLNDFAQNEALAQQLHASNELTQELARTRDRLVQSEKLATAGQLAAGVGHEINNPLAFVVGNLEHLSVRFEEEKSRLQGVHDLDDLRDCLSEAQEGARRIANIVRDLKTFARSDDSSIGAVDVKASLEFALTMASPEIRHRAEVVRDFQVVPPVEGNDTRLGQVFLVLFVNAAQAMKEGGVADNRLTVRTRVDPDGQVRVSVEDTGQGISPEHKARIFDPFFTTKAVGEGTGLGLSIAYNIVTALGGRIDVTSEVGKGSRFDVVLPASKGQPRAARTGKTPQQPVPAVPVAQVLVIDDEADMGPLISRVFGSAADVTHVCSGREGLELLGKRKFDLILCDVMMPDVSGADVYRQLERERPELLPRMVMMTGGAFTEASAAFVDSLPHEVLQKPFNAAELRMLLEVVRRRSAA